MNYRTIALLLAATLLASCEKTSVEITSDDAETVTVERPSFRIETDETFSSAGIGQYAGSHTEIYRHIDAELERAGWADRLGTDNRVLTR